MVVHMRTMSLGGRRWRVGRGFGVFEGARWGSVGREKREGGEEIDKVIADSKSF